MLHLYHETEHGWCIVVQLTRLKYWRERALMTQKELAERSGVRRQTIIAIEAGKPPRPDTTRKLAQALSVEPQRLMEGGEGGN